MVGRAWLVRGVGGRQPAGTHPDRRIGLASVAVGLRRGAACFDGLDQRRGDPVTIDGAVEVIDTRAALPDLTPAERAKLAEIKAAARKAAEPEAAETREVWIAARVAEMTDKAADDPDAIERAGHAARRALEHGVLAGDYILHVEVAGVDPEAHMRGVPDAEPAAETHPDHEQQQAEVEIH